jgi:hypothetical protein
MKESYVMVERQALRTELAKHRQEHRPATGDSVCSRGDWTGPYTYCDDERSFADHLIEVMMGFDLSDFANSDCPECRGVGRRPSDFEPCETCIVGVWS